MAQIIDGKQIAEKIIDELRARPKPEKIFAAVLVGDNPQSKSFLLQKEKVAKELGIDFRLYKIPEPIGGYTNDFLRKEVGKIALLKKVGGVIAQLPLPSQINAQYVLNIIPREKDVDVLGERALGAFYANRNQVLPPSVEVVKEILPATNYQLLTTKIAIIGAGFLIGKPIAVWLMNQKVKELTIFEKGSDLASPAGGLKNYDLVISGAGVAGLIKPEMLKDNATIIDFGYSPAILRDSRTNADLTQTDAEEKKLAGDFNSNQIENCKLKIENLKYTPTPNGTGPILVAKIFENFYNLNSEK